MKRNIVTSRDLELMGLIADRAVTRDWMNPNDRTTLLFDLMVVHGDIMPLDLDALLNADNGEFAHDVNGIMCNIDRKKKELMDCFVPRFTRRAY